MVKLAPLALLTLLLCACARAPEPYAIEITVRPDDSGVEVLVDVTGGPDVAWVGFAVGPGAPPEAVARVEGVRAHAGDGSPLPTEPRGEAGFRVETQRRPWRLSYRLDARPDRGDATFYRASVAGEDHVVLIGSDAWPRFYDDPAPLTQAVDQRPPGVIANARVRFQLPSREPAWEVATNAWPEGDGAFAMSSHPVSSVFAIGAYETSTSASVRGLRVARHRGWDVLSTRVEPMIDDLLASHHSTVEEPAAARPLVLLSPLPAGMDVRGGLRTAGMVRDQTLVVYAARHAQAPAEHPAIAAAMAVFLGHELFHLWVPSAVQVTRELSWLSEGWAMHMGRHAAVHSGWLDAATDTRRLSESYRRYLEIGGYRAGSLPDASLGSESQRNLLYLRGELVFRLLQREWQRLHPDRPFEQALWTRLAAQYDGQEPLEAAAVRAILEDLVGPTIVRRYVEGQAPLTPAALGLAGQ